MGGLSAAFLDGFTIGRPVSHGGITVYPALRVGGIPPEEPEFITLEDGLKRGAVSVAETGRMETVSVRNLDTVPLLTLDSETTLGGAQNRMLHTSSVIPPGASAELPASCVEVRRWDAGREGVPPEKSRFHRADAAFAPLRHGKMADIERSIAAGKPIAVDQKAVWRTIVRRFGVSRAKTATLDMHDLYDEWDTQLRLFTGRFHLSTGQTGMIVFLDPETWFADIFSTRDMMSRMYRKLLKGIAFEALIRQEAGMDPSRARRPDRDRARHALRCLRLARETPLPGGENRFLSSPGCFGFAAVAGGAVVALSGCSRRFILPLDLMEKEPDEE